MVSAELIAMAWCDFANPAAARLLGAPATKPYREASSPAGAIGSAPRRQEMR